MTLELIQGSKTFINIEGELKRCQTELASSRQELEALKAQLSQTSVGLSRVLASLGALVYEAGGTLDIPLADVLKPYILEFTVVPPEQGGDSKVIWHVTLSEDPPPKEIEQ